MASLVKVKRYWCGCGELLVIQDRYIRYIRFLDWQDMESVIFLASLVVKKKV